MEELVEDRCARCGDEQYDILTQPFVDAGFAGMVGR